MSKLQKLLEESGRNMHVYEHNPLGPIYGKCLAITGKYTDCMKALKDIAQEFGQELYDAGYEDAEDSETGADTDRTELFKSLASLFDFRHETRKNRDVIFWPLIEYMDDDE